MKTLALLEKNTLIILGILIGVSLTSFIQTPMILNIELENIFNSFLVNEHSHNLITTNMHATNTPPLFYWLKHIFFNAFGFDLTLIKILPALTLSILLITCYDFTKRHAKSASLGIIIALIIATSPFFIVSSKLITFDLLYILIYAVTSFIFISNVYNINYNNLATIIAGILTAACFSMTGLMGTLPIIANYLLINFIRGGFFLNLKFNNPLFFLSGFSIFVAIWITSLSKNTGFNTAIETLFNYQSLNNLSHIDFDERAFFKYASLFIIGGFPWIALFPSALWNTLKNGFRGLNSSNIYTSLPLIQLINIIILSIYFSAVESQFYVLLTIYFNMVLMLAIRIHQLEENKLSWLNIIPVIFTMCIMGLFLNEFLNIKITSYKFDSTVKEIILSSNTTITEIPNRVFYLMGGAYILSAISLFLYGLLQKKEFIITTFTLTLVNFVIFSFVIFPNLTNKRFNEYRKVENWSSHYVRKGDTLLFYKLKNPIIASQGESVTYFDDITELNSHIQTLEESPVIVFDKSDRKLVNRLNKSVHSICRKNICIKKL